MDKTNPFKIIEGGKCNQDKIKKEPQVEVVKFFHTESKPPSKSEIESKLDEVFEENFGTGGSLEPSKIIYDDSEESNVVYMEAEAYNVNGWGRVKLHFGLSGGYSEGERTFEKSVIGIDFFSKDSKFPAKNMSKDLVVYNNNQWVINN